MPHTMFVCFQVDGVAGERLIYRRRGEPEANPNAPPTHPIKLHFVLDCSGSMYRFNGEVISWSHATLLTCQQLC